jgi:60 kDa SS-A/Ro ribonucleoprotein
MHMNLNKLLRNDVFHVAASLRDADVSLGETDLRDMVDYVADRITDESEIRRSKQFPYPYFAAY